MLHFMREASKIGTTREDDTSILSSLDARTTCRMINMARFLTRPCRCAKTRRSTGVAAAGDHLLLLQGVAEMIPTARVQQGLS